MSTRLLAFLLFVFSGPVFSHSTSEPPSAQELLRVYETLLKKLEAPFEVSSSGAKAWFLFEDKLVGFEASAMERALAETLRELESLQVRLDQGVAFEREDEKDLEPGFFKKKFLGFQKFLKAAPLSIVQLSGNSVRMTREHGWVLFAVIAATQVSWELLESAVSVAIGAGGAHVACTVFNAALLASATSAQKSLKLLNARHGDWSLKERFGLTWRSLLRGFKAAFSLNKMILAVGGGHGERLSASQLEERLEEKGARLSKTQDYFLESHFIAPVWRHVTSPISEKEARLSVEADFDKLLDSQSSQPERYIVLERHMKGLNLMPQVLEQMAVARFFTPEQQGEFFAGISVWGHFSILKEYFKVEALVGIVKRALREYRLVMEPHVNSSRTPPLLLKAKLFDLWNEVRALLRMGLELAQALAQDQSPKQEFSESLRAAAERLRASAQALRNSSCAEQLIAS